MIRLVGQKIGIPEHALEPNRPENASMLSRITSPYTHGGLGLRSSSVTAPIAFLCSALAALPDLSEAEFNALLTAPAEALSPWMQAVMAAHQQVRDRLGSAAAELLPVSRELLLRKYRADGATYRVQGRLTRLMEKAEFASRVGSASRSPAYSREDAARVRSCSGPSASRFLSAPSSHPACRMSDLQAQCALRFRLGLAASNDLPSACNACHHPARHDHFHTCAPLRSLCAGSRHNHVVDELMAIAYSVSVPARKEPRSFGSADRRPDIVFTGMTETLYVDISVTHPCADTYVNRAATTAGSAALLREQTKHGRYDEWARARNARFSPFVVESFGAFGKSCETVFRFLAREAEARVGTPPTEFISEARTRVSFALQRGNALVELEGRNALLGASRHQ
jgi:hypothetical protein